MEASGSVEELLTLQEIDAEIHGITSELRTLEKELDELRATVQELEERAELVRARREAAEERARRYRRSVQAGRATLKRLETRAADVTNMKQHFAVRAETETARRNLRAAEDDALDAMQEVESLDEELREIEARLAASREAYEGRHEEVTELRASLGQRLDARREEKRDHEERLDRRALRLYETVRSGRADSALAPLTGDGVCGHCFTSVPLQRQADIRAGRELAVCEGCGVILYVPSDDR